MHLWDLPHRLIYYRQMVPSEAAIRCFLRYVPEKAIYCCFLFIKSAGLGRETRTQSTQLAYFDSKCLANNRAEQCLTYMTVELHDSCSSGSAVQIRADNIISGISLLYRALPALSASIHVRWYQIR